MKLQLHRSLIKWPGEETIGIFKVIIGPEDNGHYTIFKGWHIG